MKKWKCTVCGYVHTGDEPPEKCPVCGADKSLFTLLEPAGDPADTPKPPAFGGATRWRCTVCGYIHAGDEPPEKCPVCGADKSLFVPVEETATGSDDTAEPEPETPHQAAGGAETSDIADRIQQFLRQRPYDQYARQLTQLHGHPIAVHIPNGLLPISVLFTLLSMMFGSEGFAIAARYNIIMVALTMPLIIGTGLVDWINRFGGRMSPVFKVKMICAAVVTLLSIITAIWWISAPELYTRGIFSNLFFLIFNFANLAAAVVAGWYGGKLVFHN